MSLQNVWRAVLYALGGVGGVVLLADATSYVLLPADSVSGRERGCFTAVDLALGLSRPSELTRMSELVLGGALLILSVVALRIWRRERRRGPDSQVHIGA
jgi:hypothetical protein